jgi:adenine-specific DNA methylase
MLLSILPAWPRGHDSGNGDVSLRNKLLKQFPEGENQYHAWVMQTLGILGDSAGARKRIAVANERGEKLAGNGYGHLRAFTVTPDHNTLALVKDLAGTPSILDPFAGGGSIPFESLRYELPTIANELNPVATAVLTATIDLPFRYGDSLVKHIQRYGNTWASRVAGRLTPYFPVPVGESVAGYFWARTVPCPTTGYPTPLSPNYWLANGEGKSIAVELIPNHDTGTISTRIHNGDSASKYGNLNTYKNHVATSIWSGESFDSDYIKSKAQAGELSQLLLAVAIDRGNGREFRAPTQADLDAIAAGDRELQQRLPQWEAQDLVPVEELPQPSKANNFRSYGGTQWRWVFSPRQLLANVTILEELQSVSRDAIADLGSEVGKAVTLYLALSFDRALDYNSMFTIWDASRHKVAHTFVRHDFTVKGSFAEFEAARELVPWVVKHTITNYTKLLKLVPAQGSLLSRPAKPARIINDSATDLANIPDASVDAIITDPPYYDNVFYAECSDFFYVWMKRALRDTWPEFCTNVLTDKEREAIANPALFRDVATRKGARKKGDTTSRSAAELADARYEDLLTQSFDEAARVLKPDGIMTVMFTHKRVEAWDTLGSAILNAGFTIESSWPVATESEHSLHQAKKNAANATIFLVCRKRKSTDTAFWSDLKGEVARVTEDSVKRFAAEGMTGVDLTLACYGPALSVISKHWPVYTGEADEQGKPIVLQPDVALELARAKVAEIKKRGLLGGRNVDFDRPTDWWLIAWSDFKAREFSSGEALKLCQAMHLDLDDLSKSLRLIDATKGSTTLLTPAQRRAKNAINPSSDIYKTLVDALHALMLVYTDEGLAAARNWLERTKLNGNERFTSLVKAAINALPRVKSKGKYLVEESATLESIRATLFDNVIPAPKEDVEQLMLV